MAADIQSKKLLPFWWQGRPNYSRQSNSPQEFRGRLATGMAAATIILGMVAGCVLPTIKDEPSWSTAAAEALRAQLTFRKHQEADTRVGHDRIAGDELSGFYLRRSDRMAWSGPRGPLAQADQLVEGLAKLSIDGLNPKEYGLSTLEAAIVSVRKTDATSAQRLRRLAQLDVELTTAFLRSARHLLAGRVARRVVDVDWRISSPTGDLAGLLEMALATNQVQPSLLELRPRRMEYSRLQDVRRRYLALAAAGGWPKVPATAASGRMDKKTAAILRQRLFLSGDKPEYVEDSQVSNEQLRENLRGFQQRHGLQVSGSIDSATVAALNVSVQQRIAQLELNLERWRWLPHTLGSRYILVRIADFELDIVEDENIEMTMRVIVGKPYTRTPVFNSALTQLVFNPYWRIPRSIAAAEILPLVERDPDYLERNGIHALPVFGPRAMQRDPTEIDLDAVRKGTSMLVQNPGYRNPLGRVKFVLPNPYNIYLHDTPAGELFGRRSRDFSHGCIRLERSADLASYLLKDHGDWPRSEIERVLDSGENVQVHLSKSVPVFLLYWTAWVDDEGRPQFREDIYKSDAELNRALLKAGVSAFRL